MEHVFIYDIYLVAEYYHESIYKIVYNRFNDCYSLVCLYSNDHYEIMLEEKTPDLPTLFLECRFEPHNIKWFLVAFIILTVSCFCLIF
jgi:hypothetical protein